MPARIDQATLTPGNWNAFIRALNGTHGMATPNLISHRQLVAIHVDAMSSAQGMSWGVHTMPNMGMDGWNFLAWHRLYLWRYEQRLQAVVPNITIPYWDPIKDPAIPIRLRDPNLLNTWGITRNWSPSQLPTAMDLAAVNARTSFMSFQPALERIHSGVHRAAGGTMNSQRSPADALFWCLHAYVDRVWDRWQRQHPNALPPNMGEFVQPSRAFSYPMFGIRVADTLGTWPRFNYWYA